MHMYKCISDPIKTRKDQPQTARKCLQNIPDRGLVSKICKELSKLHNRKQAAQLKMGKRSEQTLHQRKWAGGR